MNKINDYSDEGFLFNIRVFLIKILVGKSSIVMNCKLNNCCILAIKNGIVRNCFIDNGKNPKDRKFGITIKKINKNKKSIGITIK